MKPTTRTLVFATLPLLALTMLLPSRLSAAPMMVTVTVVSIDLPPSFTSPHDTRFGLSAVIQSYPGRNIRSMLNGSAVVRGSRLMPNLWFRLERREAYVVNLSWRGVQLGALRIAGTDPLGATERRLDSGAIVRVRVEPLSSP